MERFRGAGALFPPDACSSGRLLSAAAVPCILSLLAGREGRPGTWQKERPVMVLTDLSAVAKIFRGGELSDSEKEELFKEALLMALARASSVDSNIHPVEVQYVQTIVKKYTGDDVSAPDVRVAAQSSIFETAPLEKYLATTAKKLDAEHRVHITEALAEVIKIDAHVSIREIEFFDMVASALKITPSEMAGLKTT